MRKWVRHLLDNVPLNQISRGAKFTIQHAIHMRGERVVYPLDKKVIGVKIPVATLRRISEGKAIPSATTIKKLLSFRTRYYYNWMRSVGANTATAKRYSQLVGDPDLAMEVIEDYEGWADQYSEEFDVPYEAFVWGMSESDMDRFDWESYTREE